MGEPASLFQPRLCPLCHVTNEAAFNRVLRIGRGELGAEATRHNVTGPCATASFLGGESPRESIRLASYRTLLIRPVTASRSGDHGDRRSMRLTRLFLRSSIIPATTATSEDTLVTGSSVLRDFVN